MTRLTATLLALTLTALAWPTPAEATIFRGRFARPVYYRPPVTSTTHMPGWDWWRIYPYSPYNYGRNPYNPIILPYVYPMPYPTPYPVPYSYPTYPTYTTTSSTIPAVQLPPIPPVPPIPAPRYYGQTRTIR